MKIDSKIILRINLLIKEAHKRNDSKSVKSLEERRKKYLLRWIK